MLKTCIIIEDQPPAQRILQKYIEDMGSLELKQIFNNALEAIPYLQQNVIDIVFLDIHLPKISGMDFLKTLKHSPQIILTTAFSDYAIESYEFNVVDYLLKPFSFQRFVQAITKASNNMGALLTNEPSVNTLKSASFFIKSGYDHVKVDSDTIIYINSDSDYTEVVTMLQKHLSNDSLKTWLQRLDDAFVQVHKSYIINTRKIVKISGNQLFLEKDAIVPIGRAYRGFLKSFL